MGRLVEFVKQYLPLAVTIFGFLLGGIDYAASRMTEPVAGVAFRHSLRIAQSTTPTMPPVSGRIIHYEMRNPGPAKIAGYKLQFIVPDKYDEVSKTFATGLVAERVGNANMVITSNGLGTMIEMAPNNATQRLDRDRSVGITFLSGEDKWEPQQVELLDSGSGSRPANGQILPIQRGVLEVISGWSWLFFFPAALVVYLLNKFTTSRMKADLDSKSRNIEALGYNKAVEELEKARKIEDGKEQSDPFEKAISHLKQKSPAVNQPPI